MSLPLSSTNSVSRFLFHPTDVDKNTIGSPTARVVASTALFIISLGLTHVITAGVDIYNNYKVNLKIKKDQSEFDARVTTTAYDSLSGFAPVYKSKLTHSPEDIKKLEQQIENFKSHEVPSHPLQNRPLADLQGTLNDIRAQEELEYLKNKLFDHLAPPKPEVAERLRRKSAQSDSISRDMNKIKDEINDVKSSNLTENEKNIKIRSLQEVLALYHDTKTDLDGEKLRLYINREAIETKINNLQTAIDFKQTSLDEIKKILIDPHTTEQEHVQAEMEYCRLQSLRLTSKDEGIIQLLQTPKNKVKAALETLADYFKSDHPYALAMKKARPIELLGFDNPLQVLNEFSQNLLITPHPQIPQDLLLSITDDEKKYFDQAVQNFNNENDTHKAFYDLLKAVTQKVGKKEFGADDTAIFWEKLASRAVGNPDFIAKLLTSVTKDSNMKFAEFDAIKFTLLIHILNLSR